MRTYKYIRDKADASYAKLFRHISRIGGEVGDLATERYHAP